MSRRITETVETDEEMEDGEETERGTQRESPRALQNGKPVTAESTKPPVPVQYTPGEEVTTTIKRTTEETTKIPGKIGDKPQNGNARASEAELERMRHAQHRMNTRYTDLTEWLEFWRDAQTQYESAERPDLSYADVKKFKMVVTRLADEPLLPGETSPYNTSCQTDRPLGEWPFSLDLNQFIGMLQRINGNSGGKLKIWLRDASGELVYKSWFSSPTMPLPGQANGIWEGSIPNPPGGQKTEHTKSSEPKKDRLTVLAEQMLEKKFQDMMEGKSEGKSNDESLLAQVTSNVIPTFISGIVATSTMAAQEAMKVSQNKEVDRGFFGTLGHGVASNPALTERLTTGVLTGFDLAAGVAGDFLMSWREERARANAEKAKWERIEKWKKEFPGEPIPSQLLGDETQPQNGATQPPAQPQKEDALDIIMRQCEQRQPGNFNNPELQAALTLTSRARLRGLLTNNDAETILTQFVALAESQGKGERARALVNLPQTLPFIRDMQKSLGKEV